MGPGAHASTRPGELSARSGMAGSALRFYESRGLIRAERSAGGQRRYTRSTLRRVAFIRIARQLGLSLDEIVEALSTLPDGRTPTKADWARLSRMWPVRLDERIAMLRRLRDDLTGCIGCGCLSLARCRLNNPEDVAAGIGTGPRYLLGDTADAVSQSAYAAASAWNDSLGSHPMSG